MVPFYKSSKSQSSSFRSFTELWSQAMDSKLLVYQASGWAGKIDQGQHLDPEQSWMFGDSGGGRVNPSGKGWQHMSGPLVRQAPHKKKFAVALLGSDINCWPVRWRDGFITWWALVQQNGRDVRTADAGFQAWPGVLSIAYALLDNGKYGCRVPNPDPKQRS